MRFNTGLRARAEESIAHLRFLLDWNAKREALRALESCRSFEEYFQFGHAQFGITQWPQEIGPLLKLAARFEPRVICEIGTQLGGNLFLMGQSLSSVETIIGIDLTVRNRAKLHAYSRPGQRIHTIEGSSLSETVRSEVASILGDRKIDLLFIDGDHSYNGALSDFRTYRHFVGEGGIIGFHDIIPDHWTRFERKTQGYSGEVPRLWSALSPSYKHHEFIADPDQDACGIGAIEYSPLVAIDELMQGGAEVEMSHAI